MKKIAVTFLASWAMVQLRLRIALLATSNCYELVRVNELSVVLTILVLAMCVKWFSAKKFTSNRFIYNQNHSFMFITREIIKAVPSSYKTTFFQSLHSLTQMPHLHRFQSKYFPNRACSFIIIKSLH